MSASTQQAGHGIASSDPAEAPGAASLSHVRKVFGGAGALAHADPTLRPGEVLALLCENGAGKSTCVKMLAWVYRPDEASVRLAGRDVVPRSPHDALVDGIAVMHQHPGQRPVSVGQTSRFRLCWAVPSRPSAK